MSSFNTGDSNFSTSSGAKFPSLVYRNQQTGENMRQPMRHKKGPDLRDVEIGRRVRVFRLERKMSQEKLADQLGLTFQQVQKYEKGTNRIAAGRLQQISEIFELPVSAFYDETKSFQERPQEVFELIDTAGALRLLRAYSRMPSESLKRALTTLAEEIVRDS